MTAHASSPTGPPTARGTTPPTYTRWFPNRSIATASCLIALVSLIAAAIALGPVFIGQDISKKALDLSEWTALKDFIQQCKEENVAAGSISPDCESAINMSLPPPPHVKIGAREKVHGFIKRRFIHTSTGLITAHTSSFLYRVDLTLVYLSLSLLCAAMCIVKICRARRSRILRSSVQQSNLTLELGPRDLGSEVPAPPQTPHNAATATGSQPAKLLHNQPQIRKRSAKFACPFLVYDPEKYKVVEACSNPPVPMTTIDEVWGHCFVHHYNSSWCQYCHRASQSEAQSTRHRCTGTRDGPDPFDRPPISGITKSMDTESLRWKELYCLLFNLDSTDGVPSPYC